MKKPQEEIKEDVFLEHMLVEWKIAMAILEEHLKKPKLMFPFRTGNDDRVLDKLDLACTSCETLLLDLRGEIVDKFGTIEADVMGFCLNCYKEEHHVLRWHKGGNWSCKINGEWYDIKMSIQKPSKIKRLLQKIF
jgi:hypothetical protein